MKIAITSGKGGVGKTFIATCLAHVLSEKQAVSLVDCDVEAPNSHLFLKPEHVIEQPQFQECVESFDSDKCDLCGKCAQACYFNAIVVGKKAAMAFPELCRWCGACKIVCPNNAIISGDRTIGNLYRGQVGGIDLSWAKLQTGAGGMSVALIEKLKEQDCNELTIYDSPPGTSCPVVHTINQADIVVLVTDPTVFGIHDLKLSVRMCRAMGIVPHVIINREGIGDTNALKDWCNSQGLNIIASIPDSREIAQYYSSGKLATEYMPAVRDLFGQIGESLLRQQASRIAPATSRREESIFLCEPKTLSPTADQAQGTCGNYTEIAVVSGKGGSGKTSLAACFAKLAKSTVADCDVDAADLHLLFEPDVLECGDFTGGRKMSIDSNMCVSCGQCLNICNFNAVRQKDDRTFEMIEGNCEGCGACLYVCPVDAIKTKATLDGRWYFSQVRSGLMSHATLSPGRENSGKLVTLVRKAASGKLPANMNTIAKPYPIVLDCAPGTGCPVIASVGGTKFAALVTEPTVSGLHDLKRIHELTKHFSVQAGIIINKADINPEIAREINDFARANEIVLLGELTYSNLFHEAMQNKQTVLEYAGDSEIAQHIRQIWKSILERINERQV